MRNNVYKTEKLTPNYVGHLQQSITNTNIPFTTYKNNSSALSSEMQEELIHFAIIEKAFTNLLDGSASTYMIDLQINNNCCYF